MSIETEAKDAASDIMSMIEDRLSGKVRFINSSLDSDMRSRIEDAIRNCNPSQD